MKNQINIEDVSLNNLIVRHTTRKAFIYSNILFIVNGEDGVDIYDITKNCEYKKTLKNSELNP